LATAVYKPTSADVRKVRVATKLQIAHKDFEMMRLNLSRFSIVAVALCATLVHAAPPTVTVDGRTVKFPDMQPRVMYNHVMVPLRGVFELMHANVDFDFGAQRITCVKDDATVQLMLGDKEARVNGEKVLFDAPATLSHGRTLVPVSFLAQALGARVEWDDANQTVRIQTPRYARQKA
jgi:hypothetical protein